MDNRGFQVDTMSTYVHPGLPPTGGLLRELLIKKQWRVMAGLRPKSPVKDNIMILKTTVRPLDGSLGRRIQSGFRTHGAYVKPGQLDWGRT